jgi:uncharacterized protein YndB with AHSA1/START domain
VIEPIQLSFEVACSAEQAFETWTTGITRWWPRDHTMSGDAAVEIGFEPRVGGRVFERTADGRELDWGRVTEWEPPERVAYVWHLGARPEDGTDVVVTFAERPDGTTQVDLVHSGWERLGDEAAPRRDRNVGGWTDVIAVYAGACDGERPPNRPS